jgi:hypothetical protein
VTEHQVLEGFDLLEEAHDGRAIGGVHARMLHIPADACARGLQSIDIALHDGHASARGHSWQHRQLLLAQPQSPLLGLLRGARATYQ